MILQKADVLLDESFGVVQPGSRENPKTGVCEVSLESAFLCGGGAGHDRSSASGQTFCSFAS